MLVKPKIRIALVVGGLAGAYICIRTLPVVADRFDGWIVAAWVLGMIVSAGAIGGSIGLYLRQRDEAARMLRRRRRYGG